MGYIIEKKLTKVTEKNLTCVRDKLCTFSAAPDGCVFKCQLNLYSDRLNAR